MFEKSSPNHWQAYLEGSLIRLRALRSDDFEALFAVGSDPQIWTLHPEQDRYKSEKFERYFQSGIESKGAYVILDKRTNQVIGSSRYSNYDPDQLTIVIGYTFLSRDYWGKGANTELKYLMLNHAFHAVEKVHFRIGEANFRSRRAVEKLGAR